MFLPRSHRALHGLVFAGLLAAAPSAFGYTQSGNVFTTDGSFADVSAACGFAPNGSFVEIPAGNFMWGSGASQFYLPQNIILEGQGTGVTTITLAPDGPTGQHAVVNLYSASTVRNFSVIASAGAVPLFSANNVSGWRITNITYTASTGVAAYFMLDNGPYGLIDSCTITGGSGTNELIFIAGPSNSWSTPDSTGTANATFVEDCTFNGPGYVCDSNRDSRSVIRFNTITGDMKVDGHGLASNSAPAHGVRHMEIYGNTWTRNGQYSDGAMDLRGGSGYVFNNQTLNTVGTGANIFLDDYGALGEWPNFNNVPQTPYNYPLGYQIGTGQYQSEPATAITAGQMVQVQSLGTTDFLAIGDPVSLLHAGNPVAVVGDQFVASGPGTGTGTVLYTPAATDPMYLWNNLAPPIIAPSAITAGQTVEIITVGAGINWTAIGDTAAKPAVGDQFTATGPTSTGTGATVAVLGTATGDWALSWKAAYPGGITLYRTQTGNPTVTWTMGPTAPCIVHQNQDYYKQNVGSTFDGSGGGGNGVGVGTTAQMNAVHPTLTGVGFWVTDQGSWNTRLSPGTSGQLYAWNGSAWVLKYTPYLYPDPARGPLAPTNLAISAGATYVLNWTNGDIVSNESGYLIQRKDVTTGGQFSTIATTTTPAVTTYTDATANTTDIYQYQVYAYNAAADSFPTSLATNAPTFGTEPAATPSAPYFSSTTLAAVVNSTTAVTYQWQYSPDGATWTNLTDGTAVTGSQTATITLNNLGGTGGASAGYYQVIATNTYSTATSSASVLSLTAAAQTITFAALPAVAYGGGSFNLSATASSGLTVSYGSSNSAVATVSGNTVTIVGPGSTTITASQAGDSQYQAAANVPQPLTVNRAAQTITFGALSTVTYGAAPITLTASSSSGLPITYQSINAGVASVSGNTLTILSGGTATIVAMQSGNADYLPATNVQQPILVNKADQTITFGPIPTQVVGGPAYALAATASSGLPVSYQSSATNVAFLSSASTMSIGTQGGSVTITATQAGSNQYNAAAPVAQTFQVNKGPVITTDLAPTHAVNAGANISLVVIATGLPTPTYQWQVSTNAGVSWTNLADGGGYSGTATNSMTITGASAALNGYEYRCVATNLVTATSSSATTLTVNTAPTFTVQPANSFAPTAGGTSFTATATGTPTPTYQWQISTTAGGSTYSPIATSSNFSGVTSQVLLVTNATTALNGYNIRCVATNSVGSTNSAVAVLTVGNVAPSFTSSPTSTSVLLGGTTSFTVAATGGPAPTVQWQVSTDGVHWTNLANGGGYSGVTSSTLTITGATSSLNGDQYRAVATNAGGTQNSAPATLTVTTTAPTFATQPANTSAPTAGTATFTVAAGGDPAPTLQWQFSTDGVHWTNVTDGTTGGVTYAGSTTATLTISNVNSSINNYEYQCIATSTAGTQDSTAATFTIGDVPVGFAVQPASQVVTAGTSTSFTVTATGNPAPTYQWQISTDGGGTWTNLANGGIYSGVTTSTLNLTGVTAGLNNAQYQCVATNAADSLASNAATLTVTTTAPVFAIQPVSESLTSGGNVTFLAIASGDPAPTYQWQVSTDSGVTWTNLTNGAPYSNVTGSSLSISGATTSLNGDEYQCVATNAAGPTDSNTVTLTVTGGGGSFFGGGGGGGGGGGTPAPTPAAQTITFATIGSVDVGIPVNLSATASSGLAVTFTVTSGNATISGSTLTINDTNPVTIAADQAGSTSTPLYSAAPTVTQTVTAAAPPHTFFGSTSGSSSSSIGATRRTDASGGSFAAYVNGAGTSGTIVGFLSSQQTGFVFNVAISGGAFSGSTTGISSSGSSQALTVTGTYSGGVLSGTIGPLGVSFSASADPDSGSSSSLSGFYPAGSVYSVVGTQGQVFVLAVASGAVSAGTGSVGSNGSFAVETSNGSNVTGTVSSSGFTGSVTNGASSLPINGQTGSAAPAISPSSPSVAAGQAVTLSTPAVAGASYQWQYYGANIAGATGASFTLSNIAGYQAGLYSVVVTANGSSVTSNPSAVTVNENARLLNLSARGYVGPTSAQALYAGFVVGGSGAKNLLMRGDGPALAAFGVTGAIPTTSLTLYDSASVAIATDAGWSNAIVGGASGAATVTAATATEFAQLGAFALSAGSADSAMMAAAPAGSFSAQIYGTGGSSGIGLAEIYDADGLSSTAYLSNISARAPVGPGLQALAAGFVIGGTTAQTVLLRADGPTLATYGLTGVLAHPRLTLYDSTSTVVATNIGWGNATTAGASAVSAGLQPATTALMNRVYAFALPTGSADSAFVATLPPGLYTIQIDGADGGTGIAVAEIYDLR